MNPRVAAPSRVILVDKPPGCTSFDVVRKARRGIAAKVGHAGTLDPFATGLLIMLIGQATRISPLIMELPKEYELLLQCGAVSTTFDPTGEVTWTGVTVRREDIVGVLESFLGTVMQKVPLTSAVKVEGEPLYKRAHRGEHMDTPERPVTFHDIALLEFDDAAQRARVRVVSGKGAYIRTLAHDIGERMGCGGYAAGLRRLAVGPFSVRTAVPLEALCPELYLEASASVLPLSEGLSFLPRHKLERGEDASVRNGRVLQNTSVGCFSVYSDDALLGVYEGAKGLARPRIIFAQPEE